MVTAYDFESGRPESNPRWGQNTIRLRSLHIIIIIIIIIIMNISPRKLIQEPQMRLCSSHLSNKNRAHPSPHLVGVVHWVPEQRNINSVTGAYELIDGCSLELCSATLQWYHLAYAREIKSIRLHDSMR